MKLTVEEHTNLQDHIKELREVEALLFEMAESYNTLVRLAKEFIEETQSRLQSEWDDKSEIWQNGEAGTNAAEWISEWENIDFEEIDLSELLNHAELLEALPTEGQ